MEMNPPKALWDAPANGTGTSEGDAVWVSDGTADVSKGLKPAPLNTCRLKPLRQVTRSVILSILETGHVSLEFLKCKDGVERVTGLFLVSGDGQEIYVEKWRSSCPVFIQEKCHETHKTSTWQNFSFVTLPYKYWKRYAYAYRFVELVKSKTGKVTIYSDRAKCVLMENSPPNFEANFYNGPKITMMDRKVHIQEDNGVALIFSQDSISNMVNVYTLDLIHHAIQMKEHCVLLEASIAAVETSSEVGEPLFPVTLGRRPWTSFCSSTSSTSEKLEAVSSSNSSTHLFHPLLSIPSDLYDGQTSPSPIQELIPSDDRVRVTSVQQPPHTTDRPASSVISGGLDTPVRRISTLEGRKLRCQLFLHNDSDQVDGNVCSSLPMEIEKTQVHVAMSDTLKYTGMVENVSLFKNLTLYKGKIAVLQNVN
ncbi:serine/threonine-protein kinase PLK4-like [Pomacea canaliculata]|uniref:serine/threonine-protein kinase PLK4-like n=1 Tax=Pomacea canaliculata TaxID=400727 RepID=UPI000D72D059|nr:serine/threonine-protein kinase PLK4-like [Pomacea canaliculata]XP_025087359.1 serine/threonine-protein kinase PLK4-like [Pomacea canaliculata]XP_025087360.1 serine/threonine-protein kinase PLK4-like [Pomacea canaliculata]